MNTEDVPYSHNEDHIQNQIEMETKIKREDGENNCSSISEINETDLSSDSKQSNSYSKSKDGFEANSSYPSFHSNKKLGKYSKSKSFDLGKFKDELNEVSEGNTTLNYFLLLYIITNKLFL